MTIAGKVTEKFFNLHFAAVSGMTPSTPGGGTVCRIWGVIAAKANEAMNPINVGLFRAVRVMPEAERFAALIQQFQLWVWDKDCCGRLFPGWSRSSP